MKAKGYENYPVTAVLVLNIVTFLSYVAGIYLFFLLGILWGILFIVYLAWIELSIYREGCTYCYYYGKRCAFGRGKIAPIFVKRGDPKKFCERELSGKDFIPHMLPAFLPLIPGVLILLSGFSWFIAGIMLFPLVVNFLGNPIMFGKMSCPHCKQGMKCCPAMEFFAKKGKKAK